MNDVNFYLNQVAKLTETGSDYAVGKLLGLSSSRICNYRKGKHTFDDEACLKIAEVLSIDPMEVIASMNAIKAKSDKQKAFWEKTYARISGTAAGVILALALSMGLASSPAISEASGKIGTQQSLLCKIRRLRAALAALLLLTFSISGAHAGEWSRQIGIAMHASGLDAPDISLENPLFVLEIGYRFNRCLPGILEKCTLKLEHHSSIGTQEAGYGYNVIKLTTPF